MTPLTYVLYAVGWFVLGAVTGAQWTRMRRDVRRIANTQAGEETVAQHETTNDETARPQRRWGRRVLDTFVVLLFIASAVQGYVTYDRIEAVIACQKAYQTGFADAIDARSKAAAPEKAALTQWMKTLYELITKAGVPGSDPAAARQKFAAATSEYLQKQEELTRKQQENPYPPSPRDVCG
jgi:hypothetical protein